MLVFDPSHKFHTAGSGHAHVGQQQIEPAGTQFLQYLPAVTGLVGNQQVRVQGQDLAHALTYHRVIVGDQDADHGVSPAFKGRFTVNVVPFPG